MRAALAGGGALLRIKPHSSRVCAVVKTNSNLLFFHESHGVASARDSGAQSASTRKRSCAGNLPPPNASRSKFSPPRPEARKMPRNTRVSVLYRNSTAPSLMLLTCPSCPLGAANSRRRITSRSVELLARKMKPAASRRDIKRTDSAT